MTERDEFTDIVDSIGASLTTDRLLELVYEIRNVYQLANVVYYGSYIPGRVAERPLLFLTYDESWTRTYLQKNYFGIDPVLEAARNSVVPIDWSDIDRSSKRNVRQFFADADRHGVGRQGISIPLWHPSGAYSVFSFTSHVSDQEWSAEKRQKLPELALIAKHLHQRVVDFISASRPWASILSLTERERHVLEFIASGYEIKQIAEKLDRSQTTVRNDLRLASAKLGCVNPYQAATKAIVYGVINGARLHLHSDMRSIDT